jgi:hypothetical protein
MKKYYELDKINVGSTVVMDDGKWLRVDEVEGVEFWGTDQDGQHGMFRRENIARVE